MVLNYVNYDRETRTDVFLNSFLGTKRKIRQVNIYLINFVNRRNNFKVK